jgi:hypothetical protein
VETNPAPSDPQPSPADEVADAADAISFDIMEVRYSLPMMLRELQVERTHSYFAKEIIDQVEISKIFAQARNARAKRKKF